ncbi:MAG: hypothetical protein AMXMBFR7_24800 [Planctomycetota bacterium]
MSRQATFQSGTYDSARFFLALKVSLGQLCACALLIGCACALAEEEHTEEHADSRRHHHPPRDGEAQVEAPDYWSGEHLSGDWNGARRWARERGLDFEIVYTGEVMNLTRGGRNTRGATEYTGTPDVIAELHPEKMGGWSGGTFYFWFTNIHGAGLTERHLGDFQTISNLEVEPFTTLYEYWYKHELWDGRFWIKAGKFDANTDFAASDYGGEFIHSSFGYPPSIVFGTYPDTGVGVQAGYRINDWAYVQAMLQDGAPNADSVSGLEPMFDGEGGHVSIFEFHFTPPQLPEKLPGTYRFGVWHHTGDFEEINVDRDPPEEVSSGYGLYAIFDQRLFKEREDPADEQGLGMFFQYAWAPQDRSEAQHYLGAGLVYRGAIPGRDEDVAGAGVAHVRFSNRLNETRAVYETALEFFYRVQVTPFLWLQPQLSYVDNPSGTGRDGLAAGLRFEVNF